MKNIMKKYAMIDKWDQKILKEQVQTSVNESWNILKICLYSNITMRGFILQRFISIFCATP